MDNRQIRGQQIAEAGRLYQVRRGKFPQPERHVWMVPSQTEASTAYEVELVPEAPTCTCPDFETRGRACKHIIAVEVYQRREVTPDGTVTETKLTRVTYSQDWPAYNQAQQREKERLQVLLRALCDGLQQPRQGRGRPRLPISDVIYGAVLKTYTTLSGRRASTDIREAKEHGHIAAAPHYNSIFRYLEDAALEPILKGLVAETAAPLRTVETAFAVDASGFSTSCYARWFDHKYGRERAEQKWLKAHVMTGVKTNIITSVEITDSNVHDYHLLPPLTTATAERFDVREVSADKGYLGQSNLTHIASLGAEPFVSFKLNSIATPEHGEAWRRAYHLFHFERERFLAHYHRRSNVESTFSMLKRKFGAHVRAKKRSAQVNEILCKVIAHNLCVLVSAIYELGLEPVLWSNSR